MLEEDASGEGELGYASSGDGRIKLVEFVGDNSSVLGLGEDGVATFAMVGGTGVVLRAPKNER